MPVLYCRYGSEKQPLKPDVIEPTASLLVTLGLIGTGTEWLLPFIEPVLPAIINVDNFCRLTPVMPTPWTIEDFDPARASVKALTWFYYYLWLFECECKYTITPCVTVAEPEHEQMVSGIKVSFFDFGDSSNTYEVTVYDGSHTVVGHYLGLSGGIRVYWTLPIADGGDEGAFTQATIRVFDEYTGPGTGGVVYGTNTVSYGSDVRAFTVEVCPTPLEPPVTPPPIDPPTKPDGYEPAPGVECTTLDDICSRLAALDGLVRRLASGYSVLLTALDSFDITGDGEQTIIADRLQMHIADLPVWFGTEGTDPKRIGAGWVTPGNDYGWYPAVQVAWEDQWVVLDPDTNKLGWHLHPSVVVTVTPYVRSM